jgi:TonB family protein
VLGRSAVAVIWCGLALLGACGHKVAEPAPQPEPGRPDAAAGDPLPPQLADKRWKFAAFFNAVKEQVRAHWTARGPRGAQLVLSVALARDGRLVGASVVQSSGSEALDREAMSSFRAAQPFPVPPPPLADGEGLVRFRFGFYLDSGPEGAVRFKLFRPRDP